MATSVYSVNKGINRPVEFKGFKAQYIWYLGGGLVSLLVVFAVLYIIGLNIYLTLVTILSAGTGLFVYVSRLSRTYGQHGLMKKMARKLVPPVVKSYSAVKLKNALLK